jgi:hypothetical protein
MVPFFDVKEKLFLHAILCICGIVFHAKGRIQNDSVSEQNGKENIWN